MMKEIIDIVLSEEDLSVQQCYEAIQDNRAGANAIFVGTVRNQTADNAVTHLKFEAYRPMAIKELRKIGEGCVERWSAIKVNIYHRTGTLIPGDIAVIIGVSTPHRQDSFEACQYAIDTLKETVPIWKKEYFEDGEMWVAAHP